MWKTGSISLSCFQGLLNCELTSFASSLTCEVVVTMLLPSITTRSTISSWSHLPSLASSSVHCIEGERERGREGERGGGGGEREEGRKEGRGRAMKREKRREGWRRE